MGVTDVSQIARGIRMRVCELLNHQVYSKTDSSNCQAVEEEIAEALREEYKRGREDEAVRLGIHFENETREADAAGYRRGVEEAAAEVRSYLFEKGLSVELLDLANRIEQRGKGEGA